MRVLAACCCLSLFACSAETSGPTTVDGAVSTIDGEVTDSAGGACIANDLACGPKTDPCVGDCQGKTCCSGLCAMSICSPDNVQLGGTCPTACGGTPTGTWRLAGACLSECAGPGKGTFASKDTLTVSETLDGATTMQYGFDVRCGGYINSGSGRALQGTWNKTASTIDGNPYCVQGDTLWIFSKTTSLGAYALKLTRS